MPKKRIAHVVVERSRHGRATYYYRKGRGPRIRLPDNYGEPSFWAAVKQAECGELPARLPYRKFYTFDRRRKGNVGQAIERSLKGAARRAKNRGYMFDLDFEWVVEQIERQDFRCALSGIAFFCDDSRAGARNPYAPSLDRIDCSRGYSRDNVRVILFGLNIMLSNWGEDVFRRVASGYLRERPKNSYSRTEGSLSRTLKNVVSSQGHIAA